MGLVITVVVEIQDLYLMYPGAGLQTLRESDAFHPTFAVR